MGWSVPEAKRKKILARLIKVVESKPGAEKIRNVIISARALASIDQRQQEIDLAVMQAGQGTTIRTLSELVGDAEARANALDLERRTGTADGIADQVP